MKKEIQLLEKTYIAPDIEIVVIETEQNILADGSGDIPNMPGESW